MPIVVDTFRFYTANTIEPPIHSYTFNFEIKRLLRTMRVNIHNLVEMELKTK